MAVDELPIGAAVMAAVWMMTSWRGEDKAWLRGLIARGVDEAKREGSQMLTAIRLLAGRFAGGSREEVALGDIAEMVDVVRLGLSAGLSFDAALELYCTHRTGALPELHDAGKVVLADGDSCARGGTRTRSARRRGALAGIVWHCGRSSIEAWLAAFRNAGCAKSGDSFRASRADRTGYRTGAGQAAHTYRNAHIAGALAFNRTDPLLAASGML